MLYWWTHGRPARARAAQYAATSAFEVANSTMYLHQHVSMPSWGRKARALLETRRNGGKCRAYAAHEPAPVCLAPTKLDKPVAVPLHASALLSVNVGKLRMGLVCSGQGRETYSISVVECHPAAC